MIIKYSDNNENRIYWQHRKGEEWKTAELDELIEAYEREKTGKWTVQFADNGWIDHICSECGFRHNTDIHIFLDWRYCPSCGAVMEEEKGQWEI